ncbi:MAG: BatA and WFA domain-containing protein [Anaerolineae bacterium]|nr:BatA and WFA domain-containing protein [Anaerolineae bacterium]
MNFLVPFAFALVALLPVIVALYFLKLRRTEQRVSSTFLWKTLVRDTAANAPWQRLKPNLLLLFQLLFLIALIAALARPFVWGDAAASSHLILVIDTSASMRATDAQPTRLAEAIAQARRLIENLPDGARVTLIDAGASVRVPVSGAVAKSAGFRALDGLQAGWGGTDMGSALTLAATIAENEPDAELVLLSDGHFTLPENIALPSRARFIPLGNTRENQAFGSFTVSSQGGGKTLTAFAQLVNFSERAATRRLTVRNEQGQLVTARDVVLEPNKAQVITLADLPADAESFTAQLGGADFLGSDDSAWAVVPIRDRAEVRLVTSGNRFLKTALSLLPGVQVTSIKPAETLTVTTTTNLPAALTIFDSNIPTGTLPAGNLLFIAPSRATDYFSVTGRIKAPVPLTVSADDPFTRYVDLRDVAIQDAARITLPNWGRAALIERATGAPLLIVGETDGRRIGILAFDLRHSDLPLRVAFPLLMANLVDTLIPDGAAGIAQNVGPNHPVTIATAPETTRVVVRAPDGRETILTPQQGHVRFEGTTQPGVYTISSRDAQGQTIPLRRFAVNAFNADESDISPRATLQLGSGPATTNIELPRARNEWWMPLAWLALIVLIGEWLLAYRGQVVKMVRTVQERVK